ncbi:glycosyltransferase [Rhizobium sp. C1]|nr:glycosyltransferase [Rhizobium sp. C1]
MRALIASPRDDLEFVFVDNSDDPTIMNAFMGEVCNDRRVRYLPSASHTLSMVDNWERTVAATSGRWVSIIGDDDFVDPEVAGLIARIEARVPDCDAVAWNRLTFHWPGAKPHEMNTAVPTGCRIVEIARDELIRKTFGWQDAGRVPTFMFSVYHAAVRRELLEKNKPLFGNRYFEHPVVDQDSAFKVILTARRFIFSERPFSILGACPGSNSASEGRVEEHDLRHAEFMADLGRAVESETIDPDFPFPQGCGTTAAVGVSQNWFRKTYGIKLDGWEENFVRSCALDCASASTERDFQIMRQRYEACIRAWKGGRFLKAFSPTFEVADAGKTPFRGVTPLLIHIGERLAGALTPAELYEAASGMMTPPDEIAINF